MIARKLVQRTVRAFCRDERGFAATEFAGILPFLLVFFLGTAELSDIVNQDRKVSRMTNAIADLVAQAQTVTKSELDGVFELGATILAPYPADDLTLIIASISFDANGDASVDWSYDSTGNEPWSPGTEPPVELPDTVASPNTSIVLSQSTLDFASRFGDFLADIFPRNSITKLEDVYYLRPRLTGTVQCTNC